MHVVISHSVYGIFVIAVIRQAVSFKVKCVYIPSGPAILLLSIYLTEVGTCVTKRMCKNVHCNTIQNSQKS